MSLTQNGTPCVGYATLVNGAIGPIAFTLYTKLGQPAYTLQPASPSTGQPNAERLYVTGISISSDDTTQALITVDSGGTTPTKIASQYASSVQPPGVTSFPPGVMRGIPGVAPRATASAVTATKAVQVVIKGFISRS